MRQMRRRHHRDKANDRTDTGVFPAVRRKGGRRDRRGRGGLDANATRTRLITSALVAVLCALLGFGYMVQVHNTQSSYESMTEDELRRLFTETSTQVTKLEERKAELTEQLDSIKVAADKQEQARRIAQQNEQTAGILSGRLPAQGKGVTITVSEQPGTPIDAATMFHLIEELRNAGAEVIEFDGVRVITSTSIRRSGDALVCDDQVISSPYVVKAIGDPPTLQSAVDIAGGVGSSLKLDFGATVTIAQSDDVKIETVREVPTYTYAETVQ
ncbi:DUF881 domain-containing protein [Bifidobacterium moraviense]|nr:DUF881 domain-containing protein [Bifidobacterium sp. DSM 109958]